MAGVKIANPVEGNWGGGWSVRVCQLLTLPTALRRPETLAADRLTRVSEDSAPEGTPVPTQEVLWANSFLCVTVL